MAPPITVSTRIIMSRNSQAPSHGMDSSIKPSRPSTSGNSVSASHMVASLALAVAVELFAVSDDQCAGLHQVAAESRRLPPVSRPRPEIRTSLGPCEKSGTIEQMDVGRTSIGRTSERELTGSMCIVVLGSPALHLDLAKALGDHRLHKRR